MVKEEQVLELADRARAMAQAGASPSEMLRRLRQLWGHETDAWFVASRVFRVAFNTRIRQANHIIGWHGYAEGGAMTDDELDQILQPSVAAFLSGVPEPDAPDD